MKPLERPAQAMARDDRSLSSNRKKKETVEHYKFSTRVQEEGEPLEKFIVDLMILASTCNFSTLRESLVRDRIICGIRDSKLREDLLKVADLIRS